MRNGLNWNLFLEKASENRVSAVVYSKLKEIQKHIPNIPSTVFEELENDYYLNAVKNALIFEELGRVLQAFKKSGLKVMVLKGAALAETVYGNLALRPMTDIDLMVRKEDLFRIDGELKRLGYRPLDRSVDDIDLSSSYLTTLDYQKTSLSSPSLHIHWHFVNSTVPSDSYIRQIKMEDIWQEAERAKIAQVETLVMAPHHFLIHLSEHALRVTHSLSKWGFFCDIQETINFYQDELDWEKLVETSLRFRLNPMVYLALFFTSKFLGTKIPEDVLLRLRPERLSLGEKIFMSFISANRRLPGLSYLVHLSLNKGSWPKMRFILRTFFPPRPVLAQRSYILQSKSGAIHYFRRMGEIFRHFFKALM